MVALAPVPPRSSNSPPLARPLLIASGILNALLVFALLARQQLDSTVSIASPRPSSATWCQPRPAPLFNEKAATAPPPTPTPAGSPPPPPPPPPPAALPPAAAAVAAAKQYAVDEQRLKRVWYHPPCGVPGGLPCNSRSYKEMHDSRWAFLTDRHMSRGLATSGDPLRLRCLAQKLLAGWRTHLSVLGGSVSFGTTFTTSRSRCLFHWKVYQYINASFPGRGHEHYMGAVPASGPSYMEHCVAWHLPPPGADLILVEYAVNFDGADDYAPFERLIRRLLRLPNHPAIIIVNTMELVPPGGRLPWEPDDSTSPPSAKDLAFEYRSTGAEDAINDIADYYGVPCVSLRGALFAELKANSSTFPLKQLYHDRHHPAAWGHSLMAQMVVRLIAQALDHEAAATSADAGGAVAAATGGAGAALMAAQSLGGACADAHAEMGGIGPGGVPTPQRPGPRLWAPLYSNGDDAPVGACYKDRELDKRIHHARGFRYVVEGADAKMKPGIVGYKPLDSVAFCLDVSRLDRGASFIFIIGHLISYEHMGAARIGCMDDCECDAQEVDAHVEGGKFSVFKAKTFTARRAATPHGGPPADRCGCKVHVEILNRTGSGEHKFKVLSLMTASREGSLRYGHQAGFNNRPMEARIS